MYHLWNTFPQLISFSDPSWCIVFKYLTSAEVQMYEFLTNKMLIYQMFIISLTRLIYVKIMCKTIAKRFVRQVFF